MPGAFDAARRGHKPYRGTPMMARATRTRNSGRDGDRTLSLVRAQTCPPRTTGYQQRRNRSRPRQWQGVRAGVAVEKGDGGISDTTGYYYKGGKLVLHDNTKKQRQQQESHARRDYDALEVIT